MQTFPLEEPSHTPKPNRNGVQAILRIVVTTLFILACYGAAKLAIQMAGKDLTKTALPLETPTAQRSILLRGSRSEPLFMGSDKDALRAFFSNHPGLDSRINAPLDGTGIRRIQESIEVQSMRTEADTVQVRVSSGAVSGAVYWVHHTQMKSDPAFAPIISPIPVAPRTEVPRTEVPRTEVPPE